MGVGRCAIGTPYLFFFFLSQVRRSHFLQYVGDFFFFVEDDDGRERGRERDWSLGCV